MSTYYNINKLDGVGPVDNRPSTDQLQPFVKKRKEKKGTCVTLHVKYDMWHVTCDTWHVTTDTWREVIILLTEVPSSYGFGEKV